MNGIRALSIGCLLLLAGCGSDGGGQAGDQLGTPLGDRLVAEVDFPIPEVDLRVTASTMSDADLRRLTAALADLDGVAVSEADYGPRTIGLILDTGLAPGGRDRVEKRARTLPGVAGVSSG